MEAPARPSRGSRAIANLKRLAILIVLLVGVLGGNQIWQSTFAKHTFQYSIQPEPDPTGFANEQIVQTHQLFTRLSMIIEVESRTDPLVSIDLSEITAGEFTAVGREERSWVEQGRAAVTLRLTGASAQLPAISMSSVPESGRLTLELSHSEADDFLAQPVSTVVAITNQHGTPVTALEDPYGELAAQDRGVYRVTSTLDNVLSSLLDGIANMDLTVTREEESFAVAVPWTWFLSEGESRVVQIEQAETVYVARRPVPQRMRPRQVALNTGFAGEFTVAGADLVLAEAATLVGPNRIPCDIQTVSRSTMSLRIDPAQLQQGRYRLELDDGDASPVTMADALTVQPGFALLAPAEGTRVPQGDELSLRWRAPGAAELLVEASREDDPGAWQTLFRGSADLGQAKVATDGLEPGEYVVRLHVPGRSDLPSTSRRIIIDDPPLFSVKFRFKDRGAPFGRLQTLMVDGDVVPVGPDPMLIQLSLTPGTHQVRAEASLKSPVVQTIEVTHTGQEFEFDFAR